MQDGNEHRFSTCVMEEYNALYGGHKTATCSLYLLPRPPAWSALLLAYRFGLSSWLGVPLLRVAYQLHEVMPEFPWL